MSKPKTHMAGNGIGSRITYFVAYWILIPVTRVYTRMTIRGREHIPKSGPFVLAPVHRSYVDTPIAGCVTSRRMRFMGKDTMWNNHAVGWILSALGAFPVTRGTADRRTFLRNPRPAIATALGRDDADLAAIGLFVETKQYSERVLGLGIWDPPKLPWVQKKTEQWAPETFPVTLRGRTIELAPERLDEIIEQVDVAKREARPDVAIDQEIYTVAEVEAAVAGLRSPTKEPDADGNPKPEEDEDLPADDENVLMIKQNIDGVEHQLSHPRRPVLTSRELPIASLALTRPKPHQSEGFKWLVDAWEAGWPGVLLADDMGLGKTFQALAFMAWVRANMTAKAAGPWAHLAKVRF